MTRRLALVTVLTGSFAFAQVREVEKALRVVNPTVLQELHPLVQRLAMVTAVTPDTAAGTLTVRGTQEQIDLVVWLVGELNHPRPGPIEYRSNSGRDGITRIYHATHETDALPLNELATVVRSTFEIRQLYTLASIKAIVLQGTPEQAAGAEWLFGKLDRPASTIGDKTADAEVFEDGNTSAPDKTVRVFHLAHTPKLSEHQAATTAIRTAIAARRAFMYPPTRAIVIRGTPEQLAKAESMIAQMDKRPE